MAFGQGYYPYDEPQYETLPNGDYFVRIDSAEVKEFSNGNQYALLKVSIHGKKNVAPNTIVLNEAPILGHLKANGDAVSEEDVKRGNGKLTTFFKAFKIADGDFDMSHWKGKTGYVHCAEQYDKNEPDHKSKKFKQLTPILPRNQEQAAKADKPVPPVVQQIQKGFDGTLEQDIPF